MARSIVYALGGTNIDYRINLAVEEYNDGRADAVGFLGTWQGKAAAKQFSENGIPSYSTSSRKGYIVPKNDISRTTVQSAVYGRLLADFYGFDEICICTEPFHGEGALLDFSKAFDRGYALELKTVPNDKTKYGTPPKHGEAAPVRKLHEMIRTAFEPFYRDLPSPRSHDGVLALWDRDWHLAEAAYNPLRDYVESPTFELLKRSKQTPLAKRLARFVR